MILSAVLFAAGASKRMGSDKLLMNYRGKTLICRALELLMEIEAGERIVVSTEERLSNITLPPGIITCVNPAPQEGKSSSVRLGVQAACGSHYLFLNADQPELTSEDIEPMIELVKQNPDKIVFPLIEVAPCSPTVFPKTFRKELLSLTGDIGGSVIRDRNPQLCIAYKPEHPERFRDIDTRRDALD